MFDAHEKAVKNRENSKNSGGGWNTGPSAWGGNNSDNGASERRAAERERYKREIDGILMSIGDSYIQRGDLSGITLSQINPLKNWLIGADVKVLLAGLILQFGVYLSYGLNLFFFVASIINTLIVFTIDENFWVKMTLQQSGVPMKLLNFAIRREKTWWLYIFLVSANLALISYIFWDIFDYTKIAFAIDKTPPSIDEPIRKITFLILSTLGIFGFIFWRRFRNGVAILRSMPRSLTKKTQDPRYSQNDDDDDKEW